MTQCWTVKNKGLTLRHDQIQGLSFSNVVLQSYASIQNKLNETANSAVSFPVFLLLMNIIDACKSRLFLECMQESKRVRDILGKNQEWITFYSRLNECKPKIKPNQTVFIWFGSNSNLFGLIWKLLTELIHFGFNFS